MTDASGSLAAVERAALPPQLDDLTQRRLKEILIEATELDEGMTWCLTCEGSDENGGEIVHAPACPVGKIAALLSASRGAALPPQLAVSHRCSEGEHGHCSGIFKTADAENLDVTHSCGCACHGAALPPQPADVDYMTQLVCGCVLISPFDINQPPHIAHCQRHRGAALPPATAPDVKE